MPYLIRISNDGLKPAKLMLIKNLLQYQKNANLTEIHLKKMQSFRTFP